MRKYKKILSWSAAGLILLTALWLFDFYPVPEEETRQDKLVELPKHRMDPVEKKAGRAEYFFRMQRDPATNSIPVNIRSRELNFARDLESRNRFKTSSLAADYVWQTAGPGDVGGRTRALGIDRRNPNIIITGGVSGGVWKSVDGGNTWEMKSDLSQNMSVSSVTQDPNNPDTWYYTAGEFTGNSASDRGFRAFYFGTGIYRSDDNGETWSIIPSTEDTDNTFNSRFDFISRIKVSPTTGSIFAASNAFGLLRSNDGGSTFPVIRGGSNEHQWTDFDIDSDGNIIAVFSSTGSGTPGIFYSTDDGDTWTDVTPTAFPNSHDRSVITFAPSDPTVFYVFTEKDGDSTNQGVSFFKVDITDPQNPIADDNSENLPNFGEPVGGVNLQGGYNMLVKVKPDDPDFVMIGATNLFRSTDGFATAPADMDNDGLSDNTEKDEFWIGGYAKANDVSQYPNQHPDQHVAMFDPTDNNRLWAGHDGALSVTEDVTAPSVSWTDRDSGLITSQFYTVALPANASNNRIGGGTQDNGSPFFSISSSGAQISGSSDISSGDGSYMEITESFVYSSSQRGRVIRWDSNFSSLDFVHPVGQGSAGQLFIHPFEIDPNDENIMYYPAQGAGAPVMWRNTSTGSINNSNSGGTGGGQGWIELSAGIASGFTITTLEVSNSPGDILYYGASSNDQKPVIMKSENASTDFSPVDISIPSAADGAYVHDIAINPTNSNEVLVILSNYNIESIFHTADGGNSWTAVEGNLSGTSNDPGPSVRSAAVIPASTGAVFLVGTSTGLFSTENLDGSSTVWMQEGPNTMGFAVTEFLDFRVTDGDLAVGTHGQGIFFGDFQGTTGSPGPPAAPQNLTLSYTPDQSDLAWDENTEIDFQEYRVYKGTSPDNLSFIETVPGGTTSFTDQDTSNIPLYYQITAVDQDGNESMFSDIVSAFREVQPLTTGWQLVGSPLVDNQNLELPDDFQLIEFNGAYQIASSFQLEKGYWIKPTGADTLGFNTSSKSGLTSATIGLNAGWNLIPGIVDTIAVGDIEDPDGILTSTPIQRFTGSGYTAATQILPTEGYFVFADEAGDITLRVDTSSSSGGTAPLVQSAVEPPSQDFDRILFTKNGVKQFFLMANSFLSGEDRGYYRMPPVTPEPVIDVRTRDGFRIAHSKKVRLRVSAQSYPIQVELQPGAEEKYRITGIDGTGEVHFNLQPGKSVTIPKEYDRLFVERLGETENALRTALGTNYPNPFNLNTTIRYQLAEEVHVTMDVYNVAGQKIQTLVDEVKQPGSYTYSFEGKRLTSGTYFVRMQAGSVTDVRQMTLIK